MAGITGLGTTYNLPNYTGELFQLSPADAPFLSMCGGLSGGMQTTATQFEWETETLRSSTANNVVLEGQDAPTAVGRTRSNVTNVTEIHQSQIQVSYTKQAAYGQKAGINIDAANPITDELAHQIMLEVTAKKRDVNASFLGGTYQLPTDNTTKRQTRGIIPAITTNVLDATNGVTLPAWTSATNGTITATAHGMSTGDTFIPLTVVTNTEITVDTPYYVTVTGANTFTVAATKGGTAITFASTGSGTAVKGVAVTDDLMSQTLQAVFDNGGLTESETFTLWCNSRVKIDLSRTYIKNYGSSGYFVQSRSVGGVKVDTIITDFGTLNVALERQMPKHKILVASMNEVHPVFLDIPGKGHFFIEPLAKTGAQDKVQLYGEIGLAYGAESHHGILKNLAAF